MAAEPHFWLLGQNTLIWLLKVLLFYHNPPSCFYLLGLFKQTYLRTRALQIYPGKRRVKKVTRDIVTPFLNTLTTPQRRPSSPWEWPLTSLPSPGSAWMQFTDHFSSPAFLTQRRKIKTQAQWKRKKERGKITLQSNHVWGCSDGFLFPSRTQKWLPVC